MKRLFAAGAIALSVLASMPASAAFVGSFDVSKWTTTLTGDPLGGGAPAGVSAAPSAVTLTGGDFGCNTVTVVNCTVRFTILAQVNEFKFHWDYVTTDLFGPSGDPFGYLINSTFHQLTDDLGSKSQSGDADVFLNASDTFGFVMDCLFCDLGPASATVSGFTAVPEPGSLALFGLALAGLRLTRRRGRHV